MDFLEPEIDEPKPKTKVNASVVETTREEKEKIKAEKKIKKSIFESGDISSYSQAELSALFQKHTKKAFPSLSEIELKDLSLPEVAFARGSGKNGDARSFEDFFIAEVPEWKQLDSKKPTIFIISSSAIRCVDLLKYIPAVRNRCTIAKLFAKHIKMAEQKAFLASHRAPIAIGTPARIYKLAQEEEKPIDLELVEHVIIDTHRDGKDRTVFDVAEIRKELIELLCKTSLQERLSSGAAKISFF